MALIRCGICDIGMSLQDALGEGWREVSVSWAPYGTCWCCRQCWRKATGQ